MFLVTGATGNVGSEVVEQLLAGGEKVRVFTRSAAKVSRWGNRVEVALGDFTQPETFVQAATGVDGIFLMNGAMANEQFREVIAAAKRAGAPRIVFMSSLATSMPESAIGKLHKVQEDALRDSGLPHIVLRPGGFMSNTYQWIGPLKSDGVVYNPMGIGRSAPIAPEDIAAVAVKVLREPVTPGEVLELTGGEFSTVPEQVRTLSEVLGREVRCVDVPTEVAVQNFIRSGLPPAMAAAVGQTIEAVRNGRTVQKTDTVDRIVGRPPMTFAAWLTKHAARFA